MRFLLSSHVGNVYVPDQRIRVLHYKLIVARTVKYFPAVYGKIPVLRFNQPLSSEYLIFFSKGKTAVM
jgi:hypothetical protein